MTSEQPIPNPKGKFCPRVGPLKDIKYRVVEWSNEQGGTVVAWSDPLPDEAEHGGFAWQGTRQQFDNSFVAVP